MITVYVVTDSYQEDWNIHGVFSTEEKAQEYIDSVNQHIKEYNLYDTWFDDIREFEVDELDKITNCIKSEHNFYIVTINKEKKTIINQCSPIGEIEQFYLLKPLHSIYGNNIKYLALYLWAKSPEHAVKIANEKRAQLIANGEWDD